MRWRFSTFELLGYRWGNKTNQTQTEEAPDDNFVDTIYRRWSNQRFHKVSQILQNQYIEN